MMGLLKNADLLRCPRRHGLRRTSECDSAGLLGLPRISTFLSSPEMPFFNDIRGASLIELILIILLIGAALPPLLVAYAHMQEQNTQMMPVNTSVHLATQQMERAIKGKSFATIQDITTTNFADPFQDYRYRAEVAYVQESDLNTSVDPTVTDFKRVEIIVTHATIPLNISLVSVVANMDGS